MIKRGDDVIVRTYSAGCFAGVLDSDPGKEVLIKNARRLWLWAGAFTLSALAANGTSNPGECKFDEPVEVFVTEAIEIIRVTPGAKRSIEAVPIHKP
jgi:hypothetical protein